MTYNSAYVRTKTPNMLGGAAFNPRNMLAPTISQSPTPLSYLYSIAVEQVIWVRGLFDATFRLDVYADTQNNSLSHFEFAIAYDAGRLDTPIFANLQHHQVHSLIQPPGSFTSTPITTVTDLLKVTVQIALFNFVITGGDDNYVSLVISSFVVNDYNDLVGLHFLDDNGEPITLTAIKREFQNYNGRPCVQYTVSHLSGIPELSRDATYDILEKVEILLGTGYVVDLTEPTHGSSLLLGSVTYSGSFLNSADVLSMSPFTGIFLTVDTGIPLTTHIPFTVAYEPSVIGATAQVGDSTMEIGMSVVTPDTTRTLSQIRMVLWYNDTPDSDLAFSYFDSDGSSYYSDGLAIGYTYDIPVGYTTGAIVTFTALSHEGIDGFTSVYLGKLVFEINDTAVSVTNFPFELMWLDYIYQTDPSTTISTNQSVLVNWVATTPTTTITTTYSARVGLLKGTFIWFWKAGFDINYLDAVGATFTDDAGITITITELKSDRQNTGGNPAVLYTVDQPPFMANQYPIASYFDIDIESVST
jgi:hypothetical protein